MELASARQITPPGSLAHWVRVEDSRHPWARPEVLDQMREWIREAENADKLTAAGEKVMPLLLSGETRCGKTSTLCWLAGTYFDKPVYRASIAAMIGSYMGETTRGFRDTIEEAKRGPDGIYLIDEVDGVFQQRVRGGHGGATQELNSAIATALALIEDLPQHLLLVATTNEPEILDRAMLARFRHVHFASWADLQEADRRAFARSHQVEEAWVGNSYAAVVQAARAVRVRKILAQADVKPSAP